MPNDKARRNLISSITLCRFGLIRSGFGAPRIGLGACGGAGMAGADGGLVANHFNSK